ncbi:MAG: twin-arginine translocation signal domain-containing protein, partial [Bradyrhizobium sp.]|nr:twin-arginine translocation signal domain-containing protein [Bradyrhizobium sp.]
MSKRSAPDASRRNFLKGATIASAAALGTPVSANTPTSGLANARPKAMPPGPRLAAADSMPPPADPVSQTSSGGDFMVDVFKTLDIDYLAMNCASSFRGLHEAVINHGGNTKP